MDRTPSRSPRSNAALTQRRLEHLVHAMERREGDLRVRIADERERADVEGYEQLNEYAGDQADRAFVETRVEIESGLIELQLKELEDIKAARARIAEGTFGLCIDCGDAIDYERLNVYPLAVRCAECQMLREDPGLRPKVGTPVR